jgi:GH15 family glucan-1,4-alpha-glucosidase
LPVEDGFAKKSIEIICRLQEEDGGILSTQKDDAYPFVYPRDASIMTIALNMHGFHARSMKFYHYLSRVRRRYGEIYQRYNEGMPYVTRKKEADVTPIVIQGVYDTYRSSGDRTFLESMWDLVAEGASFIVNGADPNVGLVQTNCSVHETVTLEQGFEIWANSASVRGLLDASKMASTLGHPEPAQKWLEEARKLWSRILERLYDVENGLFVKNLREDGTLVNAPDVAQLAPFYFGLSHDRKTLERTLQHIKKTLWNPGIGGVNRFRDFEVVKDWHWYTGGTGASWPLFTLWMARFYQGVGDLDSMEECLHFVRNASTLEMEIPEKVAPMKGYEEWKENETEFNERVTNAIRRSERNPISIPDHVAWACPLGWSSAEYVLLERKDDGTGEGDLPSDWPERRAPT